MVQKPEKEYFSISELAIRWSWDESEVCALIWRGHLVPSWYFSKYDSYQLYELEWDDDINDLWGSPVIDQSDVFSENPEVSNRVEGFQYLVCPKRTSPSTCEFWSFSERRGPFVSGDCVLHMSIPISLLDVKERGIVLVSEVEKYEEKFGSDALDYGQSSQTKPLSRFAAQEEFVLRQLESMKIDPLKLPKNEQGNPGIKSKIRQATIGENKIFAGRTVFDKTWERLTKNGDIAYQK